MSGGTPHTVSIPLRFALFGRFRVADEDHRTRDVEGHEATELLAYLLVHRDRPLWRERLAAELWEDASTRTSLKHLRHALWKLNTAVPELRSLVCADREWIELDTRGIWIDIAVFERAFAGVKDRSGFNLDPIEAIRLHDAAALHTSDLLTGWDAQWCVLERERLQNVYLLVLDKLMDHALAHALAEVGLGYGATSLALDPARESTHQRLMELHYTSGNRTAALRQYERCVQRLWDDLGVPPGRRTLALREAIEADRGEQVLARLYARPQPCIESTDDRTRHAVTTRPGSHEPAVGRRRSTRHP